MKSKRQAKIVEIITDKQVQTQEQLLSELQAAGFQATQATISRDIKELRIVKKMTGMGGCCYAISEDAPAAAFSGKLHTIFKECITGYDYAQNIIVIRTMPGLASAAGSAIDALNRSSVVGSLAGDDTLFVVMRDSNAAAALCGEIKNLLT